MLFPTSRYSSFFSLRITAKINNNTAEEQKMTSKDCINLQKMAFMSKRCIPQISNTATVVVKSTKEIKM